jgi:hypothetical protein
LSITSEEDILVEDELSKSERRAKNRYTKDFAEENLKEIRAFSKEFLDILCSIFLSSSKDAIGFLQVYCCCLQYSCAVILFWVLIRFYPFCEYVLEPGVLQYRLSFELFKILLWLRDPVLWLSTEISFRFVLLNCYVSK